MNFRIVIKFSQEPNGLQPSCGQGIETSPRHGRGPSFGAPSHDLWIVDERLTFAQYFSSDVDFSKLSHAFESTERPDVLIFDYVHGLRQRKTLLKFSHSSLNGLVGPSTPKMRTRNFKFSAISSNCNRANCQTSAASPSR